jgi:hypothetical protein
MKLDHILLKILIGIIEKISMIDNTGFLYGSNEKRKESNKRNRDALSLDVHNCIHNNHRLISCFLG